MRFIKARNVSEVCCGLGVGHRYVCSGGANKINRNRVDQVYLVDPVVLA